MRRLTHFQCAGETLAATLDEAAGTTGLLIVSGGNEIRIGAHRGMAELGAIIAASGHPVFRYDRRGIGDSSGENNSFESTAQDICEAAAAFRREVPQLTRIVAFGNCDAASALILFHAGAPIDALILTNPWTIEPGADGNDLPPPPQSDHAISKSSKTPANCFACSPEASISVNFSVAWPRHPPNSLSRRPASPRASRHRWRSQKPRSRSSSPNATTPPSPSPITGRAQPSPPPAPATPSPPAPPTATASRDRRTRHG
ncbi:hypothetical protein [Sphingomonas sp. J344]|uniref:hypothetical protein n=1 Tax=Sphingomonas sp. J344 TaxID=2898434 RepID=UPI0027E383F2|nr:hypothetical protein [Sphingomonas sp. J344]